MTEDKKKQILSRMQRYCALEDRSVQKIREKLFSIEEISDQDTEEIIASLLEDNFLNEARFVENYTRSKVNQKRWGIRKIRHGLIRHRIPENLIEEGLRSIDQKIYKENLIHLLITKQKTTDDRAAWIRYLVQKGYDYEEITEVIDN